jgi:hypothetical protein
VVQEYQDREILAVVEIIQNPLLTIETVELVEEEQVKLVMILFLVFNMVMLTLLYLDLGEMVYLLLLQAHQFTMLAVEAAEPMVLVGVALEDTVAEVEEQMELLHHLQGGLRHLQKKQLVQSILAGAGAEQQLPCIILVALVQVVAQV